MSGTAGHRGTASASSSGLIEWLGESGGASPKHSGSWAHPIATCLLHYAFIVPSTILVHDAVVLRLVDDAPATMDEQSLVGSLSISQCSNTDHPSSATTTSIAIISNLFACYAAILLIWRLVTMGTIGSMHRRAVLYDYCWLCNSTLIMVSIGLRTCRPMLATAFCVAVSIDQLLWWVDLLGWLLSGFTTFPIGVAKYLTWPHTSWATRITASHHLWTIPLTMYAAKRELNWGSYILSIYVVTSHVLLSRWMTPFVILGKQKNSAIIAPGGKSGNICKEERAVAPDKYLNVNLSHELWKDITFGFLKIGHDNPSTCIYLFRLLLRWHVFNLGTFCLLYTCLT